jgi:hypothetical protein
MQPVRLQLVGEHSIGAQQCDALNLLALERVPSQRMNHGFIARGPGQLDRIQVVALGGEAEILRGILLRLGVLEGTCRDLGGPFAVGGPGPGSVDGIAIDLEPTTDIQQHLLHFIRDGAVGTRPDVHQQVAILAHDVTS